MIGLKRRKTKTRTLKSTYIVLTAWTKARIYPWEWVWPVWTTSLCVFIASNMSTSPSSMKTSV